MALQYAVAGLLPLLLVPHIVKNIGLQQYGEIAVPLSWMNYAAISVQYAFHLTGPKYAATLPANKSRADILVEIYGAKLILLIVVMGLVLGWLAFYSAPRPAKTIVLVLLLLPIGAALHAGWYLQTIGRFGALAFISILASASALGFGFSALSPSTSKGVIVATLVLLTSPLLAGLGSLVAVAADIRQGLARFSWHASFRALREGWTLFVSQFTAALYGASGTIIVGALAGTADAGAYSTVERVANAIISACLLSHTVAYPKLASLYGTNRAEYWRLLSVVLLLYFGGAGLIVSIAYLSGFSFEALLFGTSTGKYSLLIFCGVVWIFLGIVGSAVTGYLIVSGRQSQVFPLTIKVLMLSLVLGVPGVFLYGAWAWLASLALSQAVVLIFAAGIVRREALMAHTHER